MPPACPLDCPPLDAVQLARESEGLGAAAIRSCIYRAAGAAALRDRAGGGVRMRELLGAVREERDKGRSMRDAMQRSMLT